MKKFKFIGCNFLKKEVILMSKKIYVGVLFIILCMFGACSSESISDSPYYGHVLAFISEEYNEKFDNREFTLEDFKLNNVKNLYYYYHSSAYHSDLVGRFIALELIKTGKKQANAAITHLSKLDFVRHTILSHQTFYTSGSAYLKDWTTHVLVFVNEEYNEKFDAWGFTLKDFEFDNAKELDQYRYWNYINPDDPFIDDYQGRVIILRLIKIGPQYAKEAIEHLNTLELNFAKHIALNPNGREWPGWTKMDK